MMGPGGRRIKGGDDHTPVPGASAGGAGPVVAGPVAAGPREALRGAGSREGDFAGRARRGMSGAMHRILLAPALALLAIPALGQTPPPALTVPVTAEAPPLSDLARLEVLPGWRTGERRHMAALRLTLAPGWKTYWRAPGSAGLAPLLDFGRSTGIDAAEARWPVPVTFDFNGMQSIGYHDAVTIPLDLTLTDGPVRLAGEIEIGVCDNICVPMRFSFAVDLPQGGGPDPVIAAALVDQPMTGEEAGARAACAMVPDGEGLALTVRLAMPALAAEEAVVIESSDPGLWVSEASASRQGGTLVATAEVVARDGGPAAVDRSGLRITVLGEGRAVDIQGCQAG